MYRRTGIKKPYLVILLFLAMDVRGKGERQIVDNMVFDEIKHVQHIASNGIVKCSSCGNLRNAQISSIENCKGEMCLSCLKSTEFLFYLLKKKCSVCEKRARYGPSIFDPLRCRLHRSVQLQQVVFEI